MIMRRDRLIAEIPPPSDPDPNGASLETGARNNKLKVEEIAQKLREAAGSPKEPTGEVAN